MGKSGGNRAETKVARPSELAERPDGRGVKDCSLAGGRPALSGLSRWSGPAAGQLIMGACGRTPLDSTCADVCRTCAARVPHVCRHVCHR